MSPIINPTGEYSFITERLAIGGLRAYGLGTELSRNFDFAVNVAEEIAKQMTTKPSSYVASEHCGFDDTHKLAPELPKIESAVRLVQKHRAWGQRVLVTCAQGRNRSALVVAETLIREGADPAYVIRTIRERRANSLANTTFVEWLMRKR